MKKFIFLSVLFCFLNSTAFSNFYEQLRPWTQADDILLAFKKNHSAPLGVTENTQINAFKEAVKKDVTTKKNTLFTALLSSVQPTHKKALMKEIMGCKRNVIQVNLLSYQTEELRLQTIEGLRVNLEQKLLTFIQPFTATLDDATKEAAAKDFIKYECEVVAKNLDVVPDAYLLDLKTRGLGFRLGNNRTCSDEEREFLKANIQHLHLLKFLVLLNLDELELTGLPDNLSELKCLNVLHVRGNKLTHVPQAIHDLQETNRLFMDLSKNEIASDEVDPLLKKSCELLWEGNIHSLVKSEELEWRNIFNVNRDEAEIDLNDEEYAFAPLAEVLSLSAIEDHASEYREWLRSTINEARLKRFAEEFTPACAMSFLTNFPEQAFMKTLYGKCPDELKRMMVCVVLDHLREANLVKVTGEEQKLDDDTTIVIPQIVQGWPRFFTREPIEKGNDAWLTAEGVQVLFNITHLLKRPCNPDMTHDDIAAFKKFEEETKMPFLISEDIRFTNSVGIRRIENRAVARSMSEVERKWLRTYKDRLVELPFLQYINFGGMGYTDVPENYDTFRDLRVLFFYNNEIASVTPKMRALFAHYPRLTIDLQYNPVMKGYEGLTTKKLIVYTDFVAEHGEPPANIKQDICIHRTIGVRDDGPVALGDDERTWVKERLEHLHKLDFLTALNLSRMSLRKLPENFGNFFSLQKIWLQHNDLNRTPTPLAKLCARNPNFKIYEGNNPLYSNAPKRFQQEVEKEHKNFVAEQKAKVLEEEKRHIQNLKSKHVKPNLLPADLAWHPTLIERLGFGPLKKRKEAEYEPRQTLIDYIELCEDVIESYRNGLIGEKLTKNQRRKEVKELRTNLTRTKAQLAKDKEQFDGNDLKYRHIFFELMLRDAEQKHFDLNESNVDLPLLRTPDAVVKNRAASRGDALAYTEVEAQNRAWIQDPINKSMLYIFLCTYTPEDFIKFFKNKDKSLKAMLEVKKAREAARASLPEIYDTFRDESSGLSLEKLQQRTEIFFSILLSALGQQGKYIPIITSKKSGNGVEMQHHGWQPYLTKKPDLDNHYTGWYSDRGVAELLVFLDLAVIKKSNDSHSDDDDNDDKGKAKVGDDGDS